jgi:hypothetical protein
MDLLDILCTSFLGLPWYHLYIISWTCSIFSLHHFMDLLDILFTSFHGFERISSKSMKCCKENIEQVHEMMYKGYRASQWNDAKRISSSPWNDVKRISSKSMKWCKEDIISWTCSTSSFHHFMNLLEILFTSFHELARYPLYIIS